MTRLIWAPRRPFLMLLINWSRSVSWRGWQEVPPCRCLIDKPTPTTNVLPPLPPSDFLGPPLMAMDIFVISSTGAQLLCVLPIIPLFSSLPHSLISFLLNKKPTLKKQRRFCSYTLEVCNRFQRAHNHHFPHHMFHLRAKNKDDLFLFELPSAMIRNRMLRLICLTRLGFDSIQIRVGVTRHRARSSSLTGDVSILLLRISNHREAICSIQEGWNFP